MKTKIDLKNKYLPSEDVVARDVHGEFIIIPITSGIADSDDEIFSLNEFGRAIWEKLDGKRDLKGVASILSSRFVATAGEIENDVLGLVDELLKRKMVVKA
ncbi:MAG TPA: PqqD family protein [Candidatus Margulisiibacteriota bacterium]|nr:PqqD family protein [Candidatus Margulisiibacteriota bacterium]